MRSRMYSHLPMQHELALNFQSSHHSLLRAGIISTQHQVSVWSEARVPWSWMWKSGKVQRALWPKNSWRPGMLWQCLPGRHPSLQLEGIGNDVTTSKQGFCLHAYGSLQLGHVEVGYIQVCGSKLSSHMHTFMQREAHRVPHHG